MSRLLEFETLHNIRDLGGEETADGRRIRSGRLIRCGHLSKLSESDIAKLGELLRVVVDLRTDRETGRQPDVRIPGTAYHRVPVLANLTAGITREKESDESAFSRYLLKPAEAKDYMCLLYRMLAQDPAVTAQFAKVIRILLEAGEQPAAGGGNAVLWHCTAGKDRAGTAAAIIEGLLGVPREDIVREYLSTNTYIERDIVYLTDFLKKEAGTDSSLADEALRYLLGAEPEYIESWFRGVGDMYGSFGRYAAEGLLLSDDDILRLREMYLE